MFANFLGIHNWGDAEGLFTAVAAFINGFFLYYLIQQVRQGKQSVNEAAKATDVAAKAGNESVRSRIDERAPIVTASVEQPAVLAHETPPSRMDLVPKNDYILPKMENDRLHMTTNGTFTNEGRVTAKVALNGNVYFGSEDDEDFVLTGPYFNDRARQVTYLKPGESSDFVWYGSRTIEDWVDAYKNPSPPNPKGLITLEVIVSDSFADGVVDHIFLTMSGRPLKPKDGDGSHWVHSEVTDFGATVYPTVRTYRNESTTIEPSWVDDYS